MVPLRYILPAVMVAAACGDDSAGSPDAVDAPAPADASVDSRPDADACTNRRPLPVEVTTLTGFASAEDFAFDADGNYVGINSSGDLVRISAAGQTTLWVPGLGGGGNEGTSGVRFLPGGDLVLADIFAGTLVRVTPGGSTSVYTSGLTYPNGVDVALDGTVYVADNATFQLHRVDATTQARTTVAGDLFSSNGVAIGPDGKIYVGSFGAGTVWEIPAGGGAARVFGTTPHSAMPSTAPCVGLADEDPCSLMDEGGQALVGVCTPGFSLGSDLMCFPTENGGLDGIAVDACGYVYVSEYVQGNVYRFPPTGGTPELVVQLPSTWIPNMHFGAGGGFAPDVLYVADRDQGRLFGLQLGVTGAPEAFP